MHFTQTKNIQDLLKKTNMLEYKGSPTSMSTFIKCRLNPKIKEGGIMFKDKTLYKSVVGALQYATLTRL